MTERAREKREREVREYSVRRDKLVIYPHKNHFHFHQFITPVKFNEVLLEYHLKFLDNFISLSNSSHNGTSEL